MTSKEKQQHTNLELSREDPPAVNVGGVCLNRLIVSKDLGCRGSGHGCQQEGVAHTILSYLSFQCSPVMKVCWCHVPHVILEDLEGQVMEKLEWWWQCC